MSKDKFVLYILVASLIVNIYFVYRYVNVKPTIIVKDKIVEKVVEVVRVETRWKIVRVPTTRPPGSSEAVLERLEDATPELKLQPIYISKGEDGNVYLPSHVGGSLYLDYLHYDLMVELDSKLEYAERPLDLRVGLFGGYNEQSNTFTDINLIYPIWGFNIGAGIQSATITKGWRIYNQTELDFGVGYLYNRGIAGILGVSFKL